MISGKLFMLSKKWEARNSLPLFACLETLRSRYFGFKTRLSGLVGTTAPSISQKEFCPNSAG